ncbi:hypothetical protein PHLGIDRAFT_117792 [Phlebiopsis gigantea 11061_1 CR5-6]|uniref:Uncharacterized protein n=1 Tax=Phlebiopsis gigantea (strain 11061_1 CR5-6) TaxID=745531 RepID=A0A0C3S8Y8_PHLG1|nr:hypothetical protein PHLGIDRAFT_117792 [Phlebiopsis gigantea 11061_1 CR5-6]
MKFTASIFFALGLSAFNEITSAAPVIEAHDVWDPTMTYPTAPYVILEDGFDVRDGHVEVTVPLVQTATFYSLVLYGDSRNWGPEFTIIGDGPL